MIEWKHLTSAEIPNLDKRLPVIIPVGLIEAHGSHLGLSVDLDTAEYFSRRIAEGSGQSLRPPCLTDLPMRWRISRYDWLTIDTAIAVFTDIAAHFAYMGLPASSS